MQEESFVFKEAKWHSSIAFQQYYSVGYILTFNWAITTDFRQMKTPKKRLTTVKQRAQNTLDDFDNY
jgi:hypothetical protein